MHNCSKCNEGKDIDCQSCKLAALAARSETAKKRARKDNPLTVEDDDYSISDELTKDGERMNIAILFVVAVVLFAVILLIYKVIL